MFQYTRLLFKDKDLLMKHLNSACNASSEIKFHALGCIEEIVVNKNNNNHLSEEFIYLIKDTLFKSLSLSYSNDDKLYHSKVCNLFSD